MSHWTTYKAIEKAPLSGKEVWSASVLPWFSAFVETFIPCRDSWSSGLMTSPLAQPQSCFHLHFPQASVGPKQEDPQVLILLISNTQCRWLTSTAFSLDVLKRWQLYLLLNSRGDNLTTGSIHGTGRVIVIIGALFFIAIWWWEGPWDWENGMEPLHMENKVP